MAKDITKIFNKFAGKEVYLSRNNLVVDETLEEMKKVAGDNGLTLRLHTPWAVITDDHCDDRVNVYLDKGADGKYRISNRFRIG
jgi:hypothetical protein